MRVTSTAAWCPGHEMRLAVTLGCILFLHKIIDPRFEVAELALGEARESAQIQVELSEDVRRIIVVYDVKLRPRIS